MFLCGFSSRAKRTCTSVVLLKCDMCMLPFSVSQTALGICILKCVYICSFPFFFFSPEVFSSQFSAPVVINLRNVY